jgi:hypothetical protein
VPPSRAFPDQDALRLRVAPGGPRGVAYPGHRTWESMRQAWGVAGGPRDTRGDNGGSVGGRRLTAPWQQSAAVCGSRCASPDACLCRCAMTRMPVRAGPGYTAMRSHPGRTSESRAGHCVETPFVAPSRFLAFDRPVSRRNRRRAQEPSPSYTCNTYTYNTYTYNTYT